MEKIVTHHPFRTITLSYDRSKPQPDWEKDALDNYFHAHDEAWRLKTMREDIEPRLDKAIAQTAALRAEIYPIDQEIDVLELATGIRKDDPMPGFEGTLSLQLDGFIKAAKRHNGALQELYELVTRCTAEYNAFLAEHETFEEWFEEFAGGPLHQLYMRYEELNVDTVSLDEDHQAFLEHWAPTLQAERDYFDRATGLFDAYAELVDASNKLYRRAERVNDALGDFVKKNKNGGSSGWKRFRD